MKSSAVAILLLIIPLFAIGNLLPKPILDVFAKFKYFSTNDGLHHNYILDIIQDKKNHFCLTAAIGLNKSNGYRSRTYRSDSSKHS